MRQLSHEEALYELLFHVKQAAKRLPDRLDDRVALALRVVARWRDSLGPGTPLPNRAGFSVEMLREGGTLWLADQRPEEVAAFFRIEGLQPGETARADLGSTWLGDGALPALLEAFLLAVVTGGPHLFRVGRQTAPLLDDLLLLLESEIGGAPLASIRWNRSGSRLLTPLLSTLRHLTLYGSQETISFVEGELAAMEGPTPALLPFGHRTSLLWADTTALGTTPDWDGMARTIADDLLLWDQRGCMAPHVLWLIDGNEAMRDALLQALESAVAARAKALPAGVVSRETVEQGFLLAEQAAFVGRALEGPDYRLLTGLDARPRRGPGGRTLRVGVVAGREAERWLKDEPLSTIGWMGAPPAVDEAVRLVRAGEMQRTRLGRRHDGQLRLRTMLGLPLGEGHNHKDCSE